MAALSAEGTPRAPQRLGADVRRWAVRAAPLVVLLLPVVVVYRTWLGSTVLLAGDWIMVSPELLRDYVPFPPIVDTSTSLGNYNLVYGPLFPFFAVEGWLNHLGLGFAATERIIWFFPAVLGGLLSSYWLGVAWTRRRWWPILGSWLYCFNSYNLVLQDRGDIAMSAAHALLPLILLLWERHADSPRLRPWSWFFLLMASVVQSWYEPRITYITLWVLGLYTFWWMLEKMRNGMRPVPMLRHIGGRAVLYFGPLACLEAWWLWPALRVHVPTLPVGSGGADWPPLLSFADIGDALALMHPFWPNDWYFLTYPTEPLFFFVPIVCVCAVLGASHTGRVLFLATLSVLSIFLAKGVNEPYGGLYMTLFAHVPGFYLYRDPLKWFHGVELAYAGLFTLGAIAVSRRLTVVSPIARRAACRGAWFALCACIILLPATPALGLFGNSFTRILAPSGAATRAAADDYGRLEQIIAHQPYGRLLWLPSLPFRGPSSSLHPSLPNDRLAQSNFLLLGDSPPWAWLARPSVTRLLELLSVRYVVIPADGPDFTYAYQSPQWSHDWYIAFCRRWLTGWQELNLGKIVLFEAPRVTPRVFLSRPPVGAASAQPLTTFRGDDPRLIALPQATPSLTLGSASITHLEMAVGRVARPTELVLGDAFTPFWTISVRTVAGGSLPPGEATAISASQRRVNGYANAWLLPPGGGYRITLDYYPQDVMMRGLVISFLALLSCLGFALYLRSGRRDWLRTRVGALAARSARVAG